MTIGASRQSNRHCNSKKLWSPNFVHTMSFEVPVVSVILSSKGQRHSKVKLGSSPKKSVRVAARRASVVCGVLPLKICSFAAADCNTRVMDLVFVVATPSSMQSSFDNVRSFIARLVQPMRINANVRVGLVTSVFISLIYLFH